MAHRTVKSGYSQLVGRLNRAPPGAPPSELLNQILALLMNEQEAALLSLLPIRPFTARKAARIWKLDEAAAQKQCETLASRALLVDMERRGRMIYVLPPPMAGFFEFSLMRVRGDLDQKLLSELFHQYLNVEEDFVKELFTTGETQLGRVFVQEPVLTSEQAAHVLDYERASEVIRTASHIGVGLCYCRHKQQHLGQACDQPLDICMTFNSSAESLTRHGHARAVETSECLDLLDQAYEGGLVQFGENVQRRVSFICNCCGCCCEALTAQRRFAHLHPVHSSNWLPVTDSESCKGCGKCVRACPVEALSLLSANDPAKPRRMATRLDESVCLGCGVCARACPQEALTMQERESRIITPLNSAHRYVLMATERGKLQDLIFDNRVLWSHRALAALLGSVLKLSPVKRWLAQKQLKSRYLETMAARRQ
ncbi:MAG: 4Fe-4S dicluster domain-containing protein [bacterium]